jgi:hypothetical protein
MTKKELKPKNTMGGLRKKLSTLHFQLLTLIVALAIITSACGGDDDNDKPEPPPPEVTLASIAVTKNPTKMSYTVGETFAPAGMEITATYSDNTTKPVAAAAVTVAPAGALRQRARLRLPYRMRENRPR